MNDSMTRLPSRFSLPFVARCAPAFALLLGAAVTVTGCSSDDAGTESAGDASTGGSTGGNAGGAPTGGDTGGAVTGGTTGGATGGETTPDATTPEPDAGTPDMLAPDMAVGPLCEAAAPACIDQMILDLSLHDDKVSDGEVTTTRDGEDFLTVVDATAGGFGQSANNPWVYVKFGPDGATRVDIDDETALESMDWDMSLRRFIVRLNGGDSGPSCVGAMSFLERAYEDVDAVPEGAEFLVDDYYTDDCTIVNDSSGLPDSPQVVLAPWWSYPGCVATTGVPHLIKLADGTVIKLVVEQYYQDAADQASCNAGTPPDGAVSAMFTLRWRPMP